MKRQDKTVIFYFNSGFFRARWFNGVLRNPEATARKLAPEGAFRFDVKTMAQDAYAPSKGFFDERYLIKDALL